MSTRHFIPSKSSLANALKETPETFTGTHLSMPNRTAQIYGRSLPGKELYSVLPGRANVCTQAPAKFLQSTRKRQLAL